ncbi:unnamed protein product [Rotaria magnacalcarata]|uniref:Uncharacterized protein n=1 Tax=Rotaria magnacalcarata TaxID=392030 RepID=A0A816XED1_9BILA|nr:unnamed protein product [Rotaria magnacalcarata]CAF2137104.1 unnamed protein product [Rotaria magnacalcarata]CAF2146190.1 unnamed protein product [Rotaria magnacalcarata]CAF4081070.1 unnamed protein product [Rotaria magnacalcarata]CAF4249861.1 unnamed protein product [Rotaria magnacalcarata]
MNDTIVEPSPRSPIERSSIKILVDFLKKTATHGLRNIGEAHSKLYCTLWIIAFLAAFGLMLYFVLSCGFQYLAYPTQTNIEIVAERGMRFPAVTVCNANPYRKDKMNAALLTFSERIRINLTETNAELLSYSLLADLFNRNETAELVDLGFQLDNMLLSCSYNGIECSYDFVLSTSSVLGNCFTFNWNAFMKKLFTLGDMSSTVVIFKGLTLTFYVPSQLNFPSTLFDEGLVVLLHDNDELPRTTEKGLRLKPGLAHKITYEKRQTIFLPKPYTNCTSSVDLDLVALYKTMFNSVAIEQVAYSEIVCYELCEQAFIVSVCSCILPMPFYTRYVFNRKHDNLIFANICQPYTEEQTCALTAGQEFTSSPTIMAAWCSHCVSQCTYTYFATALSANLAPTTSQKAYWAPILLSNTSNWTNLSLPNDFAANYDTYMSSNYLRVTITCGNRYVTLNRQEAKLTIVDTFAAIGGQTGL